MSSVTAFEAKTRFGELLERVSKGEEIVITRHEKAVARMIPEGGPSLRDVSEAVAGLRALQESIRQRTKGKATLTHAEVRSAVAKGRR